jgi:hypothetical protein
MRLNATRLGSIASSRSFGDQLYDLAGLVPNLDLNFAGTKTLDPRVTFTRASSGTYVGSDGLIKTAITNEPRFDHNPTTGESLGLLVEEARTNLLTYSEELDTGWTNASGATWQYSSGVSPADTTTALGVDGLSGTVVLSSGSSLYKTGVVVSGSTTYTFSVYVKAKAGTFSNVVLRLSEANGNSTTSSSFTVTTSWQRIAFTVTTAAGATSVSTVIGTSSSTANLFIWGAQLEVGAFPTSYIPTTTATVTRAADVASITGSNFSSFYNQTEGTVFADGSIYNTGANRFIVDINDSGVTEEIALYWTTGFSSLVNNNGVSQANSFGGTVTANSRTLHSFGYKLNDFQGYGNAVALSSDTAGTLPTVDKLTIGSRVNSTFWTNGTIKRLTYWPTRLSNTTLQQITQP